jgi:hypothetical protein
MKVDIEHSQEEVKEGWFGKKTVFYCKVSVQLTEEERHIIQANRMEDLILLERYVQRASKWLALPAGLRNLVN